MLPSKISVLGLSCSDWKVFAWVCATGITLLGIGLMWIDRFPGAVDPEVVLPGRLPVVVLPVAVGGCRAGTRGASLPG